MMSGICSAHMGPEPEPGCDLCTRDPGDRCEVCSEKLKIGDEIYFKQDGTAFYHARCLRDFDPTQAQLRQK